MIALGGAVLLASSHAKFWILDPLYNSMGWLLAQFYAVIPSFGVAIILLTMVMSLVRTPLVAKQVRNQQEMQRVQPEIKRIQAKYKSEPQKRNEAMMAVYKEHNVNPLAGCLPMVLQMPLFIVLYRLIIDLNADPDPKHLPASSELFARLKETGGAMRSFGMDLADQASTVDGLGSRLPYFLLIAIVVATGFFQQRQMMRRMPAGAGNQQMRVVGKVLPVVFGVFSYNIPAGVVLYFIVSNSFQIAQQSYLYRDQAGGGGDRPAPPRSPAASNGEGGSGRRASEPKSSSPKSSGPAPRTSGARTSGARGSGARGSGARGSGAKGSGAKGSETRGAPSGRSGAGRPGSKAPRTSGPQGPGPQDSGTNSASTEGSRSKSSGTGGRRPTGAKGSGGTAGRANPPGRGARGQSGRKGSSGAPTDAPGGATPGLLGRLLGREAGGSRNGSIRGAGSGRRGAKPAGRGRSAGGGREAKGSGGTAGRAKPPEETGRATPPGTPPRRPGNRKGGKGGRRDK